MVMVIMEENPSPIKTFLKQYQLTAANTLNGPSPYISLHRTMSSSSASSHNGSTHSSVPSSPSQATTPVSAPSPVAPEDTKSGFHSTNILQKHLLNSGKRASVDSLKNLSSQSSAFAVNGHIKKEKLYPEEYKCRSSISPASSAEGTGHIRRSSGDPRMVEGTDLRTNSDKYGGIIRSRSIAGHESSRREEEFYSFASTLHISSPQVLKPIPKHKNVTVWQAGPVEFLPPTPKRSLPNHQVLIPRSSRGAVVEISRRSSSGQLPTIAYGCSPPPSPHFLPSPIMIAPERLSSDMIDTVLDGETITCFKVGGEKRLCFPQILTTKLRGFELTEIHKECDELQIICSPCSREQLDALKLRNKLPVSAQSCGLITKSDAERLVNALLHKNPPKPAVPFHRHPKSGHHFKVYHKCFGKAKGIVRTSLYNKADALCIECVDCHGLFSPARFVAHSHGRSENRTCHWGFDSANWRNYLRLSKEYEDSTIWATQLDDFKAKFEDRVKVERKSDDEDEVVAAKRIRLDTNEELSRLRSQGNNACPNSYLSSDSAVSEYGGVTASELEAIKAVAESRLGHEGARISVVLDKLTDKISHLERICRDQDRLIRQLSSN